MVVAILKSLWTEWLPLLLELLQSELTEWLLEVVITLLLPTEEIVM